MPTDDPMPVEPLPLPYAAGGYVLPKLAESIRRRGAEVEVTVTAGGGTGATVGHLAAAVAWAAGGVAVALVSLGAINLALPFAAVACMVIPLVVVVGLWLGWRQLRRFEAVGSAVVLRVSPGWVTLLDRRRAARPTQWRRADVRSIEFDRVGPAVAADVPVAIRVNVVRRPVQVPVELNGPRWAGARPSALRIVGAARTYETRAVVSDPKFVGRASEAIAAAMGPDTTV